MGTTCCGPVEKYWVLAELRSFIVGPHYLMNVIGINDFLI